MRSYTFMSILILHSDTRIRYFAYECAESKHECQYIQWRNQLTIDYKKDKNTKLKTAHKRLSVIQYTNKLGGFLESN